MKLEALFCDSVHDLPLFAQVVHAIWMSRDERWTSNSTDTYIVCDLVFRFGFFGSHSRLFHHLPARFIELEDLFSFFISFPLPKLSWTVTELRVSETFHIFFCMSARERVKNTEKFARGISYFFVGRSQWKNSVVFTCSHPVWPRYPRHEPQRELHTEFLSRLYFSSSSSCS